MHRYETMNVASRQRDSPTMHRTGTVEFAATDPRRQNITRGRRERSQVPELDLPRTATETLHSAERSELSCLVYLWLDADFYLGSMRRPSLAAHVSLTQHTTTHSQRPTTRLGKHSGFGGFPMPHEIIGSIFRRVFPKLQRQLTRSVTIPVSTTITSQRGSSQNLDGAKVVPYISFDAIVGRNSAFHLLTNDQLEELGGVEYRALNALLFIVAGVRIIHNSQASI